jgi:hypothetical protein
MKRLISASLCALGLALSLAACEEDGHRDEGPGGTDGAATDGADGTGDDDGVDDGDAKWDVQGGDETGNDCDNVDIHCTDQIDLLFVIDNSGSMGEEQLNLARNFPLLIEQLEGLEDSIGRPVNPNVNIMVTTTDFGNPLCFPGFYSEVRDPERGAPISTNCNERIARFTFQSNPPVIRPEACEQVCPNETVAPDGNFINFSPDGDNVPDVPEADVNGDGTPDSAIAQALACIGPVGIDGCGYESTLENMLQALNPDASWNQGDDPFLRRGALLAVAIVTDEVDCSIKDYSVMEDEDFQETDPFDDLKRASSAICWNAGVTCDGPDANGIYSDCHSVSDDRLQPVSRYTRHLIETLREGQGKDVTMLGILGVPLVTEHNEEAPYEPTAGGVFDLVYRTWDDGVYPDGDVLPDDAAQGKTAASKDFEFGIGPGCTGEDGTGGFTGQAMPPVRIKEVCEALNIVEDDGEVEVRCCIESICDTDFSAAIKCLTGIISETIIPPG